MGCTESTSSMSVRSLRRTAAREIKQGVRNHGQKFPTNQFLRLSINELTDPLLFDTLKPR